MVGWLIALGVLVLLAILPIGVSALYNINGPRLRLILGPVRLTVYPAKRKKEKQEKEARRQQKSAASQKKEPSKTGGKLTDFTPLVKTILSILGEVPRKLRVNRLEMKLIMAGDDPCNLAVNYGRAWAIVGNLMPQLERLFVIQKRDVEVECDFTADTTRIFARLDLTITLGRLLGLAMRYGIRVRKEYLTINNQRKGGAKT